MKLLPTFVALVSSVACGGDADRASRATASAPAGAGPADECICLAVPGVFEAPRASLCDPQGTSGCDEGEKCAWVQVTEASGATACVPDGTVPVGGACATGAPGAATGFDDCVAGALCVGGVCADVCAVADGWEVTVGVCHASCDPLAQDCGAGEGCYMDLEADFETCAPVPPDAADRRQGDRCAEADSGGCALNACDVGFQAILPTSLGSEDVVCSALCTPVDTYVGNPAGNDADGATPNDCGPARVGKEGQRCGYVQTHFLYSITPDPESIPADLGVCYDTAIWGSCEDYDPRAMVAVWNAAYTAATGDDDARRDAAQAGLDAFCHDGPSPNPACAAGVGCVSLETRFQIFSQMLGR